MIGMRAEKSTPNANAFRTLIVGVGLGLLILVGLDPAERLYDEHMRPRPWVEAQVEILPPREGKPPVKYSVTARALVHATWKAWGEGEHGTRLCGGQGPGDYSPATESPKRVMSRRLIPVASHRPTRLASILAGSCQSAGVASMSINPAPPSTP